MKWLDNYQKVKQLRDALVWLPVWERDKRAFVPEVCLHACVCVYTSPALNRPACFVPRSDDPFTYLNATSDNLKGRVFVFFSAACP